MIRGRLPFACLLLTACTTRPMPQPDPTIPADPPVVVDPDAPLGPPPTALVDALGLSPFYGKHLDVEGLPVLSSAAVHDAALREAGYLIRAMIGHRPEILRAIADHHVRVVVMAPTEMTTDVPEHADLTPRSYWDRRARGLGATEARPATSCGEENLLSLDGDPYAGENILIHEFSHTIHQHGLSTVDPTFDDRLRAAYDHARAAGLWAGTYAMENLAEYWAEGAQSWFDTNRADDGEHGPIRTRALLVAYDPELAGLLTEVFGDPAWRYRPPAERAPAERAHLGDFDPDAVAGFVWPAPRDDLVETVVLPLLGSDAAAPSTSSSTATTVVFVNQRAGDIEVLWLDFDGNPVRYATVRPGSTLAQSTFAGHAWLLRDGATDLGVVIAADTAGRVEIE